jgi:ParB-like chromosome segregation protein Spo0J
MTLQTVSLSLLEPGRSNPRKAMDRNGLEGLAASIHDYHRFASGRPPSCP